MHKQVSGWTVNFGPNFPDHKFTPKTPPKNKLQIWDDQSLLRNTPPKQTSDLGWPKFTPKYPPPQKKLQIWGDQSLLQNTPPKKTNFRFGMTKVYSEIPPPKNFRFGVTKVYSEIPPQKTNFRFGMTKVYSEITPPSHPPRKLSESPGPRFSEYRDLLHVETLSSPDNY